MRQHGQKAGSHNVASTAVELDGLLEDATLREVKLRFWKRYRLRYPAEVMPADSLLSRCFRELDRRLLTVFSVMTVKSLMHQVTNTKKRKLIADGLYMYEDEAVDAPSKSAESYLGALFTYLLALAIAGSAKVQGAPSTEDFGSCTCRRGAPPHSCERPEGAGPRRSSRTLSRRSTGSQPPRRF